MDEGEEGEENIYGKPLISKWSRQKRTTKKYSGDDRVFIWRKHLGKNVKSIQRFIRPAHIYLGLETIVILVWFVSIGLFLSTDVLGVTDQYRTVLGLMLFHFAAPLQMNSVVQDTVNDASVSWFTFLSFGTTGIGALDCDSGSLLGLALPFDSQLGNDYFNGVCNCSLYLLVCFVPAP